MSGISHHDEQGSSDRPYDLTARFDPGKIDALLAQLGERPWTGSRPTLIPLVSVQGRLQAFRLTADGAEAADQRAALEAAAERYAMPLAIPRADAFDLPISADANQVPVRGSLVWSEAAHGWIGRFELLPSAKPSAAGPPARWQVAGVSFDEAYRVLVRGAMAWLSGHADALPAEAGPSPP